MKTTIVLNLEWERAHVSVARQNFEEKTLKKKALARRPWNELAGDMCGKS